MSWKALRREQDGPRETITAAFLIGTQGDDMLSGGAGSDFITSRGGDDYLSGGRNDGIDDIINGGEGDDTLIWGANYGDDLFFGGPGNDTIQIDLRDTNYSSLQDAFENGHLTLEIGGYPGYVLTFDSDGNLVLPDSVGGTITGPSGETLEFKSVDSISWL